MPKKIIIDSRDIYKHHSCSYCCWIEVVDGKIISICEETGRDGGVVWDPNFTNNGPLQRCLDNIVKGFGILVYKKVYKVAYAESLDPISKVTGRIERKKIERAKEKVAYARAEYESALKELAKLK